MTGNIKQQQQHCLKTMFVPYGSFMLHKEMQWAAQVAVLGIFVAHHFLAKNFGIKCTFTVKNQITIY